METSNQRVLRFTLRTAQTPFGDSNMSSPPRSDAGMNFVLLCVAPVIMKTTESKKEKRKSSRKRLSRQRSHSATEWNGARLRAPVPTAALKESNVAQRSCATCLNAQYL